MRRQKPRKDKTPIEAYIDSMSHDGRGIARVNGKICFVQGALSGEQVEFIYTHSKKDYDEARITKVITPSPLREHPPCVNYELCGGCSLQHLKSQEQIKLKQSWLLDLISRFGKTTAKKIIAPLQDETLNYRQKARLSVRYVEKKGTNLIGFRERHQPRYITEINHCVVLNKQVSDHIPLLKELINSLNNHKSIAQIEVAAGDNAVALVFRHLEPLDEHDILKLKSFGDSHQFWIYLQPGDEQSIHKIFPENHEYLTYTLEDFGLTYHFDVKDFTQINSNINKKMMNLAVSMLKPTKDDNILDLFCGLGNFSLAMATSGANVLGVEVNQEMVERAKMNAMKNELNHVDFVAANLDDMQTVANILETKCNKLIIDPPRTGAYEVVKQIEKINPEVILYISCNPATLARDTDVLTNQKGYTLEQTGVMDMFPHTAHVESIALFRKG